MFESTFSPFLKVSIQEIESQEMILLQWTNLSARKTFPHSKKKGNGPNFCLPLTKVWERYRLTEGDKYWIYRKNVPMHTGNSQVTALICI